MEATQPVPIKSTWGPLGNVVRVLWMVVGRTLLRLSFDGSDAYRCWVLRRFGAKIGRRVRLARSCRIEIPWTLDIRDDVHVGERSILYSLGPIEIGEGSVISHFAHLCAGSHDFSKRTFDLTKPPIVIGKGCWIGPDAFVGGGVTVGDGAVLLPRACAFKNVRAGAVIEGNPGKERGAGEQGGRDAGKA
ncbi:MAG: hypothetical protein K2Y21_00460 [Phycisphaerales bacterium]|nr:hypothetical protein [Phycisphaerales bacterium]